MLGCRSEGRYKVMRKLIPEHLLLRPKGKKLHSSFRSTKHIKIFHEVVLFPQSCLPRYLNHRLFRITKSIRISITHTITIENRPICTEINLQHYCKVYRVDVWNNSVRRNLSCLSTANYTKTNNFQIFVSLLIDCCDEHVCHVLWQVPS